MTSLLFICPSVSIALLSSQTVHFSAIFIINQSINQSINQFICDKGPQATNTSHEQYKYNYQKKKKLFKLCRYSSIQCKLRNGTVNQYRVNKFTIKNIRNPVLHVKSTGLHSDKIALSPPLLLFHYEQSYLRIY